MNRPNKKDYWHIETEEILDIDQYYDDLENYCNFLEWKLEATNEALNDHIKALDKACKVLESRDKLVWRDKRMRKTAKEWEKWLFANAKRRRK